METIRAMSDRLVSSRAAADPVMATLDGVSGQDGRLTDYSPDGHAARADIARAALRDLDGIGTDDRRDRIAKDVIRERLTDELAGYAERSWMRDLTVTGSSLQHVRHAFDQMPRDTGDQWRLIAQRMAAVPNAMDTYTETLREGMRAGVLVPRRQVLGCIAQARTWAGLEPGSRKYFSSLADGYVTRPGADRKTDESLRRAAATADIAFGRFAVFLADEYLPSAPEHDAVGRDRYVESAKVHLGDEFDAESVYAWAWEELRHWEAEVEALCKEIAPGSSRDEVVELLDGDHERWIQGERALCDWISALLERAMRQLDGGYFDIPTPLKKLRVRVSPPGGAAHRYYVAPSEDLERPGTYWYPVNGRSRFPMWAEISTAYHEGVPGHHLQLGLAKYLRGELTRFQRNLTLSGLCEGWALYAERLMAEIGILDRPEYRLDLLFSQLFRTARVIIDIGMHLELMIPEGQPFHPGERWTPALGREFLRRNCNEPDSFVTSEIDRYLGAPGHAICFKLGEQEWLAARARRQQVLGGSFDLKGFHMDALSLGAMGLARFRSEIDRLPVEEDAMDETAPQGPVSDPLAP
jgi:uncharacterized protein (DUF885 family)